MARIAHVSESVQSLSVAASIPDIDLHDRAVQLIARRFALPVHVAAMVVTLAGIGGGQQ
jgi:hypothetical protein